MAVNSNYIRQIEKSGRRHSEVVYRIEWLDFLRGLTVISMICYHWMWDVCYIFGHDFPWFRGPVGHIWQQSICWSFILFSGFSLSLSRHGIRRGIIVSACGVAVTLVTWFVMPDQLVMFGVLTFLGLAMIIGTALKPAISRIPPVIGVILCAALFFLFRNVNAGYLGFEGFNIIRIPDVFYNGYVTALFGFPGKGFFSTDYFSLIPWLFLFLLGYFIFRIYEENIVNARRGYRVPVIGFIGRHALIIYVLHQPVIYGILYFINMF